MGALKRRAGNAVFLLVLFGLTLGALAHVAVRAKQVEVALQLAREGAAHEELIAQQNHLKLEIGKLKDPRRLVNVAQSKLGMTPRAAAIKVVPATAQVPAPGQAPARAAKPRERTP